MIKLKKIIWESAKVFFKPKGAKEDEPYIQLPMSNVKFSINTNSIPGGGFTPAPGLAWAVAPTTAVNAQITEDAKWPEDMTRLKIIQEDQAPDFMEPIVGWRAWTVDRTFPMSPYDYIQKPMSVIVSATPKWFLNSVNCNGYHKTWKFRMPAMAGCYCFDKNKGTSYEWRQSSFTEYSNEEKKRFDIRQYCDETCGIYASDTRQKLFNELLYSLRYFIGGEDNRPILVIGEVNLWGRVDVHEHGYRADYAYPKSLTLVMPTRESSPYYLAKMVAAELEENYGVQVSMITWPQLAELVTSESTEHQNLETLMTLETFLRHFTYSQDIVGERRDFVEEKIFVAQLQEIRHAILRHRFEWMERPKVDFKSLND